MALDTDMMEVLVKQEPTRKQNILRFILIWIDFMLFFYGVYTFYFYNPVIGLILEVMAVAMFIINRKILIPRLNLEYEYLYYNKTLNVDVIYGQVKRKNVGEYDMEKMEILAPSNSHHLDNYKHRTFEEKDFGSGIPMTPGKFREKVPYTLIYDGKQKILLDLPEDFVKMVHNNAPRKVYFD